ncbi:hypothetical protein CQW23_27029 [Capsicum baccatum]|uniref:F-box domain-containing protein n=1 Tax=Capsicum baccatum TaxID=33114 RepID=A0A2G2VQH0_CAPBA|nr:hypothetical protein CQW23_27029 [Capsicum baccatum]
MHISKTTSNGKKKQHHVNICIPKEVVVEILQRVPCQDLYETLKKVCMLWCSIIYSGRFAYSHVERGILKSSSSFSQLEAVIVSMTDDKRSVIVSALEWHSFPSYAHEEHERYWESTDIYMVNDVLSTTVHRIRKMMRSLKAISDTQIISEMKTGAHVKGVLYWYKKSFTHEDWPRLSERIERLICFDLSKEEFDMIMVPDEIDDVQGGGQYVYVAHSITDLSSIKSWKKEFTVTVPNMAYNTKINHLFFLIVTDDMLVIQLSETQTYGFLNVATGILLDIVDLHWSHIIIPYVPSLVTLFHRPQHLQHTN